MLVKILAYISRCVHTNTLNSLCTSINVCHENENGNITPISFIKNITLCN